MLKRHELREQVFRLVFRHEFYAEDAFEEQKTLFHSDLPAEDTDKNISEENTASIVARCGQVVEKIPEIDRVINENTEGWDTERMGKVELAVLRLAVYEIRYDEDIPAAVAINEAVELAKKYGQANSGAFVNAILGKIAKTDESSTQ